MARAALLIAFAATLAVLATAARRSHHPFGKPKVTDLHFFLHDTVSGPNPTTVLVASDKNLSSPLPLSAFGNVWAIDDPLTSGPEADSELVGHARGFYIQAARTTMMLVLGADFGFEGGPHNGSSFSVFSRNPVMETERELAVVGGRGAFRMAQGFARLRTHSVDINTGNASLSITSPCYTINTIK